MTLRTVVSSVAKELILGEDLALRQHVHQRGLPYVGIADEAIADELATVLALHRHLAVDDLQLGLEVGDTVLDDTAVGLELRLPRATHPHTPTLALNGASTGGSVGGAYSDTEPARPASWRRPW